MRAGLPIVLIAVAAVSGASIGAALALVHGQSSPVPAPAPPLHAQATWPAGAKHAPDFRLRDQAGRLVTLSSERGRVVLLTFLDSHCRTECPIQGALLAGVQRRLGAGARADLVVVTVDPWADTRRSTRAFAVKARWRGSWHWLLGSAARLRRVWAAYDVAVLRTRTDVTHSTVLYLIDRRGFQRAAYLVPFSPRDVAADVRELAAS